MSEWLTFEIPGPPAGKGRPRFTKTGRTFTPKDTAAYENLVKICFIDEFTDHVPWEIPVEAEITAYYPIPKSWTKKKMRQWTEGLVMPTKKPDTDNIAKIVLDSLNGIAFKDDAYVTDLTVRKRYSNTPRTIVELRSKEKDNDEIHQ